MTKIHDFQHVKASWLYFYRWILSGIEPPADGLPGAMIDAFAAADGRGLPLIAMEDGMKSNMGEQRLIAPRFHGLQFCFYYSIVPEMLQIRIFDHGGGGIEWGVRVVSLSSGGWKGCWADMQIE